MHIETVPNRNSTPAVLLRESYREGASSQTHAAQSHPLAGRVARGFARPVERRRRAATRTGALTVERSLPHGHVAAVLGVARSIGLDRLLGPKTGNRPRDLVLAMIVNRIIAPASKLATARALNPATAASSLGVELGLGEVDEDELYAALDWLRERQPAIETALAKRHLKAARWCSTMCRRAMWKAAAVRWPARLQPRRQERQIADRLRAAVRGRRLSRRHRGLRGQYRRSQNPGRHRSTSSSNGLA